jgi:soluble lytic murein transglycosylase-like protein
MILPEWDRLISVNANFRKIDANVVRAIIQQESKQNRYAVRYEPGWEYLLNPGHYAAWNGTTEATEIELQKMSWGLGQLMGSVARELGHEGPMGQLFDPAVNIALICLKIKNIMHQAKTDLKEDIFSCYNGGLGSLLNKKDEYPNQEYVNSCLEHYKTIGG